MYPIKHHHNPSTQGGWMDRWMDGWMDDDPEQHNQRVAISWCFAEPIMRVDGSWVRKSPSYVSYDGVLERPATIHMKITRPQERTQKCAAECDDNPINQMMTDGHWQFNSQSKSVCVWIETSPCEIEVGDLEIVVILIGCGKESPYCQLLSILSNQPTWMRVKTSYAAIQMCPSSVRDVDRSGLKWIHPCDMIFRVCVECVEPRGFCCCCLWSWIELGAILPTQVTAH